MKSKKPFYGILPSPPVPTAPKYPSNGLGDRLDLYRHCLGLKGYQFAKHLGISQGSYSDIKHNKSLPSCNTIIKLYEVEENLLTIKWILTGKKS